jgi:hypothetical protein
VPRFGFTAVAHMRRRSCGANLSMPARPAAARTTSESILGDMPSPQSRALLIARKRGPSSDAIENRAPSGAEAAAH